MNQYTIEQKQEALAWLNGLNRAERAERAAVLHRIGDKLHQICEHYFSHVKVNAG